MYEELIKRLRYENLSVLRMCDLMDEAADAIEEMSVIVRAQKAVLDKYPKWVPVAERLPNAKEDVLCATDAHEVFIAACYIYDDGNEFDFDDDNGMMWDGRVTHWMPLPEPPKE